MKNKLKHSKNLFYIIGTLGAVALTSIGFATWVVTAVSVSKTTNDITVDIADVKEQTVDITLLGTNGVTDGTVKFDACQDNTDRITSSTNNEDLNFGIKFQVDMPDTTIFKGISIAAGSTSSSIFNSWISNGYIVSPIQVTPSGTTFIPLIDSTWVKPGDYYLKYSANVPTKVTNVAAYNAHINVAVSGSTYIYTIDYKFQWGSAFNNQNPVLEKGDFATTVRGIKSLSQNNQLKFNLIVKHDPKDNKVTIA